MRKYRTALLVSGGFLALITANPAMAQTVDTLPTGGNVVAGSATIGSPSSAAKLDVIQASSRAVIEWNSFDIGQNAEVAFTQPSASAIALNRVIGGTAPSLIAGKLTANGIVAVLNSNGVLFAGTADVNVGGLIASTGKIDDTAFMAGGNLLGITGANGGEIVVSAGASISVANAGLGALVAPSVRNSGTITATAGRVQLGAGTAFTLDLANDGLLQIDVGAASPLVQNLGSVFAGGGQIQLSARQASALLDQTIRTGVLPVGSARLDGNTIVLDATGSDVQLTSDISGRGDLVLSGSRIYGTGDLDIDGNLTLNVNAGGAVADTLATGQNWINDALGVIGGQVDATTINLGSGLYRPGVSLTASNVMLDGQGAARVGWVSGIENAIDVWGDNVTVRNLEVFGPATSAYTSFNWGGTNSRGVFVHNGADNATVTGNNVHDIRTGVIVDGRNLNAVVTGNRIDNTKSAISVQYTDGSNVALGGNFEGSIGNEWGINVHLNGILQPNGVTINPSTSLVGGLPVGVLGAASLAEQQRLLGLRDANNGMSVQNIAYSAANRTGAYVSPTGGSVTQGSRLSPLASVQAGVNAVVTGGTVFVLPGEYTEGVTGVGTFGGSGSQQFGLHVPKDNLTIQGVDSSWQPISRAEDVAAYITAMYQAGFGAQHFVSGSNVTIEGLGFRPAAGGTNKTLEVVGNNFTLRNSVIDNRANATAANFYISDFEEPGTPRVESFTLADNILHGGTTVSAMVVVGGGVGRATDASNRQFTGNQLFGDGLAGRRGFQIQGRMPSIAWQQLTSGAVSVGGNVFTGVDIPVRTTGILTSALDWDGIFRGNGNTFVGGAVLAYQGETDEARGVLVSDGGESYDDIRITRGVQASIDRALAGDTVRMLDGTYNIGSTPVSITRSLNLVGQSQSGVIFDGRGVGAGLGTMQVQADNVSLSNFTLYGADSGASNYGIKVQPNSSGGAYSPNQRLYNFAIDNVTVRGSMRAELDLNGVVGATISNFTADGRRVANNAETAGAGVQITDSSNITLTGVHTLGNAWGSVALYQANKPNAYNGETTNINIDASQNTFEESIGVFSQLESTTQDFGQLNLTGFNYAVRNTDHRPDNLDGQFIFYRTSLTDAAGFAKAVGTASASSIEGYTGTGLSNVFTVVDGLSINSAIRDVRTGGTVNVGAGTYGEAVAIDKSLSLSGAGMNATSITGGMLLSGALDNVVLRNFAVSGSANGTSVIGNSGAINGLTLSGVRIDGQNVTNRHGLIGGQIGGAISITGSEFLNIRGWAAFDTRSGAGGNDGAQITSGVFSNNLIDNTIGHIAFRQQSGAITLPNIAFSGNTVRNIGNATNSFGAIFKAFNANQVDFAGNNVSGVGTSGFNPASESAYGAVLMTRGTAVLNVTGNTFTGNNQVFAVEPGRGLPGVTNFTGNTFTNNAYAIYLPGNLSGAGTISFGAGNNFVAGPDTLRHIVWRSPDGLDLTGVSFNGTLASNLSLAQAFSVEDLITHGIDLGGAGLARVSAGQLYVTTDSGTDAALRAVALGSNGDTLNLSAGTHTLTGTLFLTKDIDVVGQGEGVTILDARGQDSYGIRVHADNVALSGFSLNGSAAATDTAYGIKVESGGGVNERNTGFAINNVAVVGTRRTGLDLSAVVGATIDGVNVTGAIAGTGIAITDSANVVVRNSTTSGNAGGGLALYQTNDIANGGSNQQLNDVVIEASNTFGEANGVHLRASSTLTAPGTISLPGYGYTVRNPAHRPDGAQFTYFQKAAQAAYDYAVGLGVPGASVVQGWTGSANDRNFYVGHGTLMGGGQRALSLQAAFDSSANGDTINVASGTYPETATLAGTRSLNFGTVVLDGLALDATTAGNSLIGNLTLATGNFTAAGPLTLAGATSIAANNGNISLGAVTGAQSLTLGGTGLTLGATNIASLAATGAHIATSGVTTTGAQNYAGALTLDGAYSASAFKANGATTLGGGTTIAAGGNLTFGSIGGAHALTLSGNALTLGATNIGSLAATGSDIATAGVTTTGAQSYTGPVTLNGDYSASAFNANGATTLGGATAVATAGNISLGAVTGAQSLTLTGKGLTVGAANVASLAANGNSIATGGVTTTGAQNYDGPVTLNGGYSASTFKVNGATTLGGATSIAATGNIALGSIGGAQSLNLNGNALTLGATNIASLAATGNSIATSGVTTSGAQNYAGPVKLNGSYSASALKVNGATTLGGATTVAASGNIAFGSIGGGHSLTLGGGGIALGATNITSLTATGSNIATAGVTTTGAQNYTGPVTLNGAYSASAFTVAGTTTLGGATTVAATGNVTFGSIGGAHALTLSGNALTLGATNIASLAATGSSIATSGVTTSGAQSYTGVLTLNGVYSASAFTVVGTTTLGGATAVATGGNISLGAVTGAQSLTLTGKGLTLGATDIASLAVTGSSIATSGVTTTGAQSYTGALTLNGAYSASAFTVAGATTLDGAATVAASGNIALGSIGGAKALTLNGKVLTLGATNIASLAATGSDIATAGVTTTGAQSYTGALTLNGAYRASTFAVTGATTLGGAATVAASGNISLNAVTGAQSLTLSGTGLMLGATDIASLAATGTGIATGGVNTTGAQSYTGATTLNGAYRASAFTVAGTTTLGGATTVAAGGNIALGSIGGGHSLTLGGGEVALGATNIASLAATGSNIATAGVTTTGAQSYTGPVTLNGDYSASAFNADGATTLGGATAIATAGNISLGAVTGAQALTLSGTGLTLGAINIASLAATGNSIATSGVTTSGAQNYAGALTLNGAYSASTFAVTGATTLSGATTLAATGNVTLGTIGGAYVLTLSGNALTLGATNIASLAATGNSIATSGVTTSGVQSFNGATALAGTYQATGFTVAGPTTLVGGTRVTSSGAATFGAIDGTADFALVADAAALGALGENTRLASVSITSRQTVLNGATYRANGLSFAKGENATVRLTQAQTTFDTTAVHGAILIAPHLIGTENALQSAAFVTGTGAQSDGDIVLGNVGSNEVRLGDLSVTGGDFSAATVKLAGDFISVLGGSQVFSSQTLDTLGNVKAQVTGSESGPIVAGGAVSLTAGGSGAGSITAGGAVVLAYSSEMSRAITSQSSVSLTASGPVSGSISATGAVGVTATGAVSTTVTAGTTANISSVAGVSSNVTAGGGVSLSSSQGAVNSQVTSGGTVSVNAVGPVTGSITATGPVGVTATGPVSTTVKTNNSATIASVTGVSSTVTAGGGVQLTSSQGSVSSQVKSGGAVSVNASGPVTGSISATGAVGIAASGAVSTAVNAGTTASISSATGVSSTVNAGGGVNVSATQGAVTGSITAGGAVAVTAQGPVSASVSTPGAASVVSSSGGVSSTISAGGSVSVAAPGPVTSSINSGGPVALTSSTPIDVQVTGGAVTVNAPGGEVSGNFSQISTDSGGTFVVNDQPVVGGGNTDARQIINDRFLAPAGGVIGGQGEIILPSGLVMGLIAPAGMETAGRPAVVVNSVDRLGELLRVGYTAVIIQLDQSSDDVERELTAGEPAVDCSPESGCE
ncbi:filamentous hemagglutinin N-terminal domain-containing protein [Croceibacterium aestuarii]|uniref:filamentous hemagglutinin N-terminal domain-containing protein n=1 Tax=Croceibacterium aestuarii TaxID=3064139 RepID=UPI00272DE678|nr:filamentous hemagglutinin N-terminal domain-containing protein [Croceibacterium sp. D39]